MSNYLSKTKVSVASKGSRPFPMSPLHLTTGKFMHFEVAFAKELMPKSNFKDVNHKTFVRCMPLKKPILSAISFHKSAYFVPFRTVWEPFTDFKEDTPHVQQEGAAILGNVPLISNNTLVDFFIRHSATVTGPNVAHDFVVTIGGQIQYRKFLPAGRDAFKLLRSLGYSVYFTLYGSSDRTQSALPLLSLAKVYLDYFFPNQYAHSGYYVNLDGIFSRQYVYTLSSQDLDSIFEVCRFVAYDSDYFTSAFDSPLGPSAGVVSQDYILRDLSTLSLTNDVPSGYVANNILPNGTPVIPSDFSSSPNITQELDDKLKALTNYIRRHGLAGSRSLERYIADFGVALSADKLKRCYKLGEKHFPLQISDIVSKSDTIQEVAGEVTGAALGDYAGAGVAFNGDFNFDCDVDEFGYLFVIQTIVPEIAYYQGTDKNVLHKTRLDFFTADFDGLSTRPITSEELFVGMRRDSKDYDAIFGFTPVYAEYKLAPDQVTGDFVLPSLNVGLLGWSTVREFSDEVGDSEFNEVHGFNFIIGNDWEQFNRIFADGDDDSDKFVMVHRCNMKPYMPARPLYDFYDFDDGGEQITLDVNGVKSN